MITLDIAILAIFLLITLIVGMGHGKQVKNIKDYALGDKNFSNATLAATIVATFASGSVFFIILENTCGQGLYYLIAALGIPLNVWLSGQLAMRMREFMHHVSVAEAMGSLYGRTVQIITACSCIMFGGGFVAMQFKVMAKILAVMFNVESTLGTCLAAIIVIAYASFGGIKAVTFTDIFQFTVFTLVLPMLTMIIWVKSPVPASFAWADYPNFDPKQVMRWDYKLLSAIGLFLYYAIPGFSPSMFQRIAMARHVYQARKAFTWTAGILFLMLLITSGIAVLLLIARPGLEKSQVVPTLIDTYVPVGLKGLLGAGVMALAMSSADSDLNALSVIFANDLVKPLTQQAQTSVKTARSFSIIAGGAALLMALYSTDLLKMILLSGSFYMPVFAVPMLMSVLRFRTSSRVVIMAMAAGFITVVVWSLVYDNAGSIFPGMLANLSVLLGMHYLLDEPGGWQKPAADDPLVLERAARRDWRRYQLKNFTLLGYLKRNLPQDPAVYFWLGLYIMLILFPALFFLDMDTIADYGRVPAVMLFSILAINTALVTFPVWPAMKYAQHLVAFLWPVSIATVLSFSGMVIVIMNSFQASALILFTINAGLLFMLLHWPLAIVMASAGVGIAIWLCQIATEGGIPWTELAITPLAGFYLVMLVSGCLLLVFMGKNKYAVLYKLYKKTLGKSELFKNMVAQFVLERNQAVKALGGTEKLLIALSRLQKLQDMVKDREETLKVQEITDMIIPIALQLQGLGMRMQDYLRLSSAPIAVDAWMDKVKVSLYSVGFEGELHTCVTSQQEALVMDAERINLMIVNGAALLRQPHGGNGTPLYITIEDTTLCYAMPNVEQGYVKQVKAVRIGMTTRTQLPAVAPSYTPDLTTVMPDGQRDEAAWLVSDRRTIKAHYGYVEASSDTIQYVVPVDVTEVRPKDMDKGYMVLGTAPIRANDRYKDDEKNVDAHAQEQAFLAAVAAQSSAATGVVKLALELIKWLHGPVNRHSGEPFYLHPLAVAQIVMEYDADRVTILGALLHDTVEDTAALLGSLEHVFGREATEVVDVVTHLQSVENGIHKVRLSAEENIRMLESTGNKRALYVKIADRLHNVRTIEGHKKLKKQKEVATETMQVFVPLAKRLGLKKTAAEFEERCEAVLCKKG